VKKESDSGDPFRFFQAISLIAGRLLLKESQAYERQARQLTRSRLKSLGIPPPPGCEHCLQRGKTVIHHWSYSLRDPLDIAYLCRACHDRYRESSLSEREAFKAKVEKTRSCDSWEEPLFRDNVRRGFYVPLFKGCFERRKRGGLKLFSKKDGRK